MPQKKSKEVPVQTPQKWNWLRINRVASAKEGGIEVLGQVRDWNGLEGQGLPVSVALETVPRGAGDEECPGLSKACTGSRNP